MIHIVTDSTATILPEILAKHSNIHMVSLTLCIDGEYVEESKTTIDDVIAYSEREKKSIPTSQPSTGDFLSVFNSIPKEDSIICINLTSAVSGTVNGARLAAKQCNNKNVAVIDSHTTAIGICHMVQDVLEFIDAGMEFNDIVEKLNQVSLKMRSEFTIPTLDYLRRGGRLGKAAGLIGSILKIKPIIYVDETNQLDSLDKVRTEKKAISNMIKYLEENSPCKRIGVVHLQNEEKAKLLKNTLQELYPNIEITVSTGTPVLAAYLGPGLLGIIFESL